MPTSSKAVRTLVIGSRGSQLALWQARYVASQLQALGIETRLEIIKTTGDRLQTLNASEPAGKGIFTKEIEQALLARAIDIAVHSLKDLPAELPHGLAIAAVPRRVDARDVLVGYHLAGLPRAARIGTGSGRRAAQIRSLRPDVRIEPIRGNVDTRLRKLRQGHYDALILAAAGLRRLGLADQITQFFDPQQVCPAPGQGALAIQTRAEDPAFHTCAGLNHEPSRQAVVCERAILGALGGGCDLPMGAFAEIRNHTLEVFAVITSADGAHRIQENAAGSPSTPKELGRRVAHALIALGAKSILAEAK
jgi:hydroxymethylbilane synthase